MNEQPNQGDRTERLLENILKTLKAATKELREALEYQLPWCIEESAEKTHEHLEELAERVEKIGMTLEDIEAYTEEVHADFKPLERAVGSIEDGLADLQNIEVPNIANAVNALSERMDSLEGDVSTLLDRTGD